MPRGQVLAFPSGERAIVYGEGHLDGRLVDRDSGQRDWMFRVSNRIPDAHLVQAGHRDDFSCLGLFRIRPFKPRVDCEV